MFKFDMPGLDLGFGANLGSIGGLALATLVIVLYLAPSLIAFNRGVELRWAILILNVAVHDSGIAWLVALYLATRKVKTPLDQPA
ncbi:superinfection immunity protein [Streptomyces sp. BG9H]|uniref:Superinfection immunity protein n=1 Tax=Streptomyces anatolicus TaxID=2675858 RepID=A0ABS6YUC6_9ACTN|nr:superinfection immunity protein [Streptomyces anatolicus]MBW5425042.1 superinfection immunity protein [Streptomyces anatolicus]